MPGTRHSSSAPLLPTTLQGMGLAAAYWGHLYPEGKETGMGPGFQPPLGWWWVAQRCQTPMTPLKIPSGGLSPVVLAP